MIPSSDGVLFQLRIKGDMQDQVTSLYMQACLHIRNYVVDRKKLEGILLLRFKVKVHNKKQ